MEIPFSSSDDDCRTTVARPRKIINCSASISQREFNLGRALVISVFGTCMDCLASSILTTVSQQFEIDEAQIFIRCFGPASFLLTLPDAKSVRRVYGEGRPIISASYRLHIMCWSRFLNSSTATLPVAVELELRGIPTHAWELETAVQLLNDFCWINGLYLDTHDRRDVFRLATWCSSLEHVPTGLDLEIVEPPVASDELPAKRSLIYRIDISIVVAEQQSLVDHPSSSPLADGGRRRRRRRQQHNSPVAAA